MSLRPALLLALSAVALLPAPGGAAEITEVADAADDRDPFDLEIEVGWHLAAESSTITREALQVSGGAASVRDVTELDYQSSRSSLLLTARAGLYRDLELHLTLPIVLSETQRWKPADLPGLPESSTLRNVENICPDGQIRPECGGDLFPYTDDSGRNESYRSGLGDGTLGFAWGILDHERDRHTATWVVGVDWTFPSGARRNPLAASADPDDRGGVGLETNFFTFSTAFSRRFGPVDPFVRFWYRLPNPTHRAFENCEDPTRLADLDLDEPGFQNTCGSPQWAEDGEYDGGYRPSHAGGFDVGTELLPYVDPARFIRTAVQVSMGTSYVSAGRNYSQLTDALGRLTWTQDYLHVYTQAGFRLQASRFAKLHLLGSVGWDTPHLITGESVGVDLDGSGKVEIDPNEVNPERNPNFDFRFDQPGRRLRVTDVTHWSLMLTGELNF